MRLASESYLLADFGPPYAPPRMAQADDKDFKAELGRIAEMDVWDNTKEEAVRQLKDAATQLARLQQEQAFRSGKLQDLAEKVGYAPGRLVVLLVVCFLGHVRLALVEVVYMLEPCPK